MDERNHKVTKANRLIEARYRLDVTELKFLLLMASYIQPEDTAFRFYRVKIKELFKILGLENNKRAYQVLKKVVIGLQSKRLVIKKKEKGRDSELHINWIASSEYINKEGVVEFEFSDKLKPYLLQLHSEFTSYQLKNVIRLKSIYSIRLYELLKQYEKIGRRLIELDEIKRLLWVENRYKLYGDFKRNVLKVAEQELPEKTDLRFTFKEIKTGRRVTALEFFIERNDRDTEGSRADESLPDTAEAGVKIIAKRDRQASVRRAVAAGLERKEAEGLWKRLDELRTFDSEANKAEFFGEKLQLLEARQRKQQVANPAGFLYKALADDYAPLSEAAVRRAEAEEAVAQRRADRNARQERRAALEAELARLDREFFEMRERVCEQLFAEQDGLLEQVMEEVRDLPLIYRVYDESKDANENYRSHMIGGLVRDRVEQRYGERFTGIQNRYRQARQRVQRQINELLYRKQ